MKCGIHPSTELVSLFKEKPYQGQNPQKAKILIIGNDANYSSEISNHRFFDKILDYHSDGINFWRKYRTNHPFLLTLNQKRRIKLLQQTRRINQN